MDSFLCRCGFGAALIAMMRTNKSIDTDVGSFTGEL